jgi:antitoxin FitA
VTTLTIPDVDDAVAQRLRTRAVVHGRTLEDEARAILTDAVGPLVAMPAASNIADAIRAIMAPIGGADLAPYPDQPAPPPPSLG